VFALVPDAWAKQGDKIVEHTNADNGQKTGIPANERRSILDELQAVDPNIFTKVPELREVIRREQQFSERFASVEDAEASALKAQRYDIIETSLLNGDLFSTLQQLNGKNTSESVDRLVEGFLPALLALSKDLYIRATRPAFLNWFETAYRDGEFKGDKGLMAAAEKLAVHLLATEEQRQAEERYRTFNHEVLEEAYSRLQRLVFDGIDDPDRKLTAFTRKAIARDTLAELDRRLEQDLQLASTLQSLWSLAHDGGYRSEHREALLNAHVSRAQQLLPGILGRIVAEALGQQVKPSTERPIDWDLGRDVAFVNARKH